MIKALVLCALGGMLCLAAPTPAAAQDQPLSGEEVKKLFEGNTELGEGRKDDLDTGYRWKAFYASDGTIHRRSPGVGSATKGTWFVDGEGRICFRWEGWDVSKETKCDTVVREDDHYLRVREGQVRGLIRIQEGKPADL